MTREAVVSASPITYARNGDVHLAYQVVGDGELDIVWVPGWFSDIESMWEVPGFGRFLQDLAGLGRLILFDKRGTGQSDRVLDDRYPSFEDRVGDVIAVMDAAGSPQAALVGLSEGGTQALLTAARHPERTRSVVAINAWAKLVADEHQPELGVTPQQLDAFVARAVEGWATGADVAVMAQSRIDDPLFIQRWTAFERRAASPGTVEAYGRTLGGLDIRSALADIDAPTLIVHSATDRMVPAAQSHYIADAIAGARRVELPGSDHLPFFAAPEVLRDEVQRHLLGRAEPVRMDRRFATVLFVDIVGSTQHAASVGDRSWASLLDAYERVTARVVQDQGGRVVKSLGDGTLAIFSDPEAAVLCAGHLHAELAAVGVRLRAGLHCGQIEVRGDDVGGIAVHIAARVAGTADPGSTVVSSTVREILLGSAFELRPREPQTLNGVPGEWTLFELMRQ